jgi:hypothetical protein
MRASPDPPPVRSLASCRTDYARLAIRSSVSQTDICLSSTAFWDAYLRGKAEAQEWLTGEGCRTALGENAKLQVKLNAGR